MVVSGRDPWLATLCLANCNRIRRLHLCSPSNNPISEIWLHSSRSWLQQPTCLVPADIGRRSERAAASELSLSALALHVSFACHSTWYSEPVCLRFTELKKSITKAFCQKLHTAYTNESIRKEQSRWPPVNGEATRCSLVSLDKRTCNGNTETIHCRPS